MFRCIVHVGIGVGVCTYILYAIVTTKRTSAQKPEYTGSISRDYVLVEGLCVFLHTINCVLQGSLKVEFQN